MATLPVSTPCPFERPLDHDLAGLFDRALLELQREDGELATRMAARTDRQHAADQEHPGLTYWVYETTLVYMMFKAWLPSCDAVWEPPYPLDSKHHVDIAIRGRDGHLARAFEAKWWNSAGVDQYIKDVLATDVGRLLTKTSATTERYLVLFWWNTPANREHAVEQARELAQALSTKCANTSGAGPRHGGGALVQPRYLGWFDTRRRTAVVDFVMSVMSVDC
ncbi:MAG: hypothetical protein JNK64_07865 [Myxococcales bacterium]|nr:hypothetical protein [Myxococcales bacterium]